MLRDDGITNDGAAEKFSLKIYVNDCLSEGQQAYAESVIATHAGLDGGAEEEADLLQMEANVAGAYFEGVASGAEVQAVTDSFDGFAHYRAA